ncbi:MAG: glycosyltransferase [Solirubrobacteraceae bacterium]|nr:glycosyltransferase [Solirubrobacteraceae bacterium]
MDTLIRAFGKVLTERPEATLDIVGDGPDRLKLERLVREHGLEASTQFSGHCDRDTVAMKLRAADLLVSASWWENLPGVQLEALASGTPVVATSVGGVPELITHDTGTLVPPGDSDSLARAIHQTLDRHIEPARLRAAVARFAPAVVLARWDDAYRRLAQDHERRLKRRRNKLTNST